jgi:hypothetical protein
MKKIFQYISFAFVGGLLFASCEKSRPVVYTGEKFVAFEDTLLTIPESSAKEDANGETQAIPSIATIRINRGSGDISKDLVVSFSVKAKYVTTDSSGNEVEQGDVPAGSFYLSSPSAVTIKAGEGFAFVTLTAVDNDITDGNKKLTFTLESASDASFTIGYPGPDKKAKSMVLYIEDDDCPLDINDFVGNLKVKEFSGRIGAIREYLLTSTLVNPTTISVTPFFYPTDAALGLASNCPVSSPVQIVFQPTTKSVFIPTQPAFQYTCGSLSGQFRHAVDGAALGLRPSQLNTCGKFMKISYGIQNLSNGGLIEVVELGDYRKQ